MKTDISIVGLGQWLPPTVRRNSDWPPSFSEREARHGDRTFNDIPESSDPEAARITARDLAKEAEDPFLGGKLRRVACPTDSSTSAEILAARAALDDAGVEGSEVDLVLSYSIVPDHVGPYTGPLVAKEIGAMRALALQLDAACAVFIPQLDIAASYIQTGRAETVLVTQSHLLLRAFPMEHPAVPGLGDGATAAVIRKGPGLALRSSYAVTHGEFASAVRYVRGRGGEEDTSWWQPGGAFRLGSHDHDAVKHLMRETVAFGAATVTEAAKRAAIPVESIDVLASVHPRGFIPGAIAERLGLPRYRAPTTYEETGHLGACGPLLNLIRARSRCMLRPGGHVAIYAQGAGFSRAAAILEVVPATE